MTAQNTALEAALHAISTVPIAERDEWKASLMRAKNRVLLRAYAKRWGYTHNEIYIPKQVETFRRASLCNVDTEAVSQLYDIGGVTDLLAEYRGMTVLFDHKTTSYDISDPNSFYWRQLQIDNQPNHYALLLWQNGIKVERIVWDVVRKPTIKPKTLTKAETARAASLRTYYGLTLTMQEVEQLVEKHGQGKCWKETLPMYEARLYHDATKERPEFYFQRRTVPKLDADILDYSRELWEMAQDLDVAQRNQRWTKNPGACLLYNTPCKFLGICSGHDTPDSNRWRRKECMHSELADYDIGGDGRELLTNSRLKTFLTCKQKAYLEYELGIERVEDEDKESLIYGSLWHHAMNTFFRTLIKERSKNDGTNESPVNEVGRSTVT